MTELGTVEHQLDILQQGGFKKSASPSIPILEVDALAADLQNSNDVTFSSDATQLLNANGSFKVPALVFPSVKNKPSSDSSVMDGADALLTGVRFILICPTRILPVHVRAFKSKFCIPHTAIYLDNQAESEA